MDDVLGLEGSVDCAMRTRVEGWARDPASPHTPVTLLISADGMLLARVLADRLRADLRQAGIGDGRHSFSVAIEGLAARDRHLIAVQREDDGAHLRGSPVLLTPLEQFDEAFRGHCAAVLADATDDASVHVRLAFLAGQAEALLKLQAERRGQQSEREKLRQVKWRWTGSDGAIPAAGATLRPRALIIDQWMPVPSRDAGSNAILSHIHALQQLGFEVTFAAADMATDRDGVLEAAGVTSCEAPWHGSVEEVLRREANSFDLVYLHRASVAARYLGLVRFHQPKTRLVFSVADLHHLRLARQAEVEQRPQLMKSARRFQVAELQAVAAADAVITHSSHEARLILRHLPAARVHVVPWSVPTRPTAAPFAERSGVGFVSHYGHPPNLDAAQWLIDEIMPLVRAKRPDLECLLAGSNMPDELRGARPGIKALGQVKTLAEVFERVRLTVAPLTYGAGIKGKVIESLAAGIPCVCSPIAAEGLDLPPALLSLVARDASDIAANIVRLHEDAALNRTCREQGLSYVAAAFSEARINDLMRDVAGLHDAPHVPAGAPFPAYRIPA
jgi:glycosyltransferase involved in cell wall biosynthesis